MESRPLVPVAAPLDPEVAASVDAVRDVLVAALDALPTAGDGSGALAAWSLLGALVGDLRTLRDDLGNALGAALPAGRGLVGDVLVERRPRHSDSWTGGDDLWRLVVRRSSTQRLVDRSTGEALESEGECVARVLRACLQSPRWSAPNIKALGVDPDEFRTRSQRGWSLSIVSAPKENPNDE